MEVYLHALLENYDRPTDQPTDRTTDEQEGSQGSYTSNNATPDDFAVQVCHLSAGELAPVITDSNLKAMSRISALRLEAMLIMYLAHRQSSMVIYGYSIKNKCSKERQASVSYQTDGPARLKYLQMCPIRLESETDFKSEGNDRFILRCSACKNWEKK